MRVCVGVVLMKSLQRGWRGRRPMLWCQSSLELWPASRARAATASDTSLRYQPLEGASGVLTPFHTRGRIRRWRVGFMKLFRYDTIFRNWLKLLVSPFVKRCLILSCFAVSKSRYASGQQIESREWNWLINTFTKDGPTEKTVWFIPYN